MNTHCPSNAHPTHLRHALPAIALAVTLGIATSAAADSHPSDADASNGGPLVTVEAPQLSDRPLPAPVPIALSWSAQDGAEIDLSSLRVRYKLGPASKDVTRTILTAMRSVEGSRLDSNGLFVPSANLPPGRHRLVIELADTQQRRSLTEIELRIAKR